MVFDVEFKTPDVMDQAPDGMSEEEKAVVQELVKKFLKYEEYITVRFNTDDKTAIIIPNT